jgi:CrcB protein
MISSVGIVAVSVGGVLGALSRYGLNEWLRDKMQWPLATVLVNLTGCLVIGVFMGKVQLSQLSVDHWFFLLAVVGFLGSLTTFSGFGWDALSLIQSSRWIATAAYLSLQLFMGVALVAFGKWLVVR